ncbi:DUF21 domain-containing protein [Clostridium sp. MCC353]|uniref:hemolysin family protein n=1 Tax=Clostridium sp. MCC353 TaxID=2592646 RepID=UPI001C01EEC8|nr:hemolysin family protein [Clostridium sp. MCC353]MBT9779366.1 DUF21 domain-containing protein [Clostridium sp. MCC353]
MDDGYSLYSVIIFLLFILLDAVFYGFGSAIQNINISNLEKDAEEGGKKAELLLKIAERPAKFINAVQILTNLTSMVMGAWILRYFKLGPDLVAAGMVLLVILISFGIIIPKRLAAKNPEKWGYQMVSVVRLVVVPMMPFIWIVSGISYLFLKLVGIDPNSEDDNVTEEDIMSMVNEGHEHGVLEASEAEMITNIFEFDDKEASDIMTHRKNIVALDASMTLKDAVRFILKVGNNSRYPVFEKDIDDIIGILHMKDALIYSENHDMDNQEIGKIDGLLREAHFIPETRNINSLFKEMQSQKIHMEIVVDEYGQTAGIVTMEDILEEIVGNIMDEYDVDETFITPMEGGAFELSGMTPLEDVAEALSIEFGEEDYDTYDTLNGFLISKLDRIPQENEDSEISFGGYLFKILKVENKMIHSVKASRILPEEEAQNIGIEPDDNDRNA